MKITALCILISPPSASVLTNRCLNGRAADAARAALAREAG